MMLSKTEATHALYLGLNPPHSWDKGPLIHFPVIRIIPRSVYSPEIQTAYQELSAFSHLIFTSQTAVNLFFSYADILKIDRQLIEQIPCIAVGSATAKAITKNRGNIALTAQQETAEGVVDVLKEIKIERRAFFWPHSAGSRPIIRDFFKTNNIKYQECIFYETHPIDPLSGSLPDLTKVKELIFTSPSTVDAFLHLYGSFPNNIQLTTIGPVTQAYLNTRQFKNCQCNNS